jgi:hypothetical protein
MRARPVSEVKGLWFTVGRRYVLERYGPELLDECVARLGERHGIVLAEPLPSAWYPEETLQQMLAVLDVVLARGDPGEFVQIIEECSLLAVNHFFRALLRLVPPATMLRKVPTMWGLVRRGVGRVAVDADETHGVVRYTDFPYFDDAHYRLLTIGALRSLMVLCERRDARVEIVQHTSDSLTMAVVYPPASAPAP